MNLPPGYQLSGASEGPTNAPNVPHGYVLDPMGYTPTPSEETTALGAAGRGAVGMIPLGTQAYSAVAGLAENKPYLQERQEVEKEIQADIANHEPARLAGQATGLVVPTILSGGATAPASMAEAAGQGPAKAIGEAALGTGLGAVGGAVGQKLAGLVGKATPKLEEFAAKKAAQGVGMGSKELGNMTKQELVSTGKMLMDKNIVRPGASTQEMFDTAKA